MRHFSTIAFLLLLIFTAETVWAERVSETEALQKAKAFMSGRGMRQQAAHRSLRMAAKGHRADNQLRLDADYYVFNAADEGGFVIVSGDDRAVPILGYADSGSFSPDSMPDALRCLLESYAEQMASLVDEPVGRLRGGGASSTRTPISPLISSRWNQGAPYNNDCPEISGKKTVTGCAATSMAQLMYYYQYPTAPTTTVPGYSFTALDADRKSVNLTLDALPSTTFDWANMTPTYSDASTADAKAAVAELMQYCGWSLQTRYGLASNGGSSAFNEAMIYALKNYFGYDTGINNEYRKNYSYTEWVDLIYSELAARRPVIMGGQSVSSGHSFVCDGYDTADYFHINWGWGGSSDGYFRLSALNPYEQGAGGSSTLDGFTMMQQILLGVQPPVSGSKSYCLSVEEQHLGAPDDCCTSKEFVRAASSVPFEGISCSYKVCNYSYFANDFDIALQLVDGSDAVVSTLFEQDEVSISFNHDNKDSRSDLSIPATVPDGTYYIKMMSRPHGTSDWQECLSNERLQFTAVISGNSLTVTVPRPAESLPSLVSLTVNGNLTTGYEQDVVASLKGGAADYHGDVSLRVNGQGVVGKMLDIPAGQTVDAHFVYTPSTVGDNVLTLYNKRSGGSQIGSSTTISVLAGDATNTQNVIMEPTVTNLTADGKLYGNGLRVTIQLTNSSADYKYVGKLNCSLREYASKDDAEANYLNATVHTVQVIVEKSGAVNADFAFDLLNPAHAYRLRITATKGSTLQSLPVSEAYEFAEGYALYAADGTATLCEVPAEKPISLGAACFVDLCSVPDAKLATIMPSTNPNCVYLLPAGATVPEVLNDKNVVLNDKAGTLTITDDYDFFTPVGFEADEVSYAREFTLAAGGTSGWNTIVLPFDVSSVTCTDIGTVDWFHSATDKGKNFWLRAFTADSEGTVVFDYADRFLANTPYIIAVPDDRWGKAWQMAGDGRVVTFHGENVTIAPTVESAVNGNHYKFLGGSTTTSRSNFYQLDAEGSTFLHCAAKMPVAPFRAVFAPVSISSLACASLAIGQPETTGFQMMSDVRSKKADVWYTLDGRKVSSHLKKGIYVRNGRKVVIK